MANCIMGFPNFVDSDYYSVVLTGGDWLLPLSNLKNPRLSLPAKSDGVTNADTWFEVDLGGPRNIKLGALPSTNSTLDGQRRLRITDTPAFSNSTTVGANGSSGASTVTFEAPAGVDIDVTTGDFFTIGGYLYKSNTTATITGGSTDVISLATSSGNDIHYATLQADVTTGDTIRCNTGDYTSPNYDSGQVDIFGRIYSWGSLPWEHPSFWTGKATEEERQTLPFPVIDVLTESAIVGEYAKYEFFDTTNTDTGFAVSRLFLTPGWQPTINPAYGANIQYKSDTTFDKSHGGEKIFDVKQGYRSMSFTIDHLDQNEALSQALEMQRTQGLSKQMFFVFEPDATENLHRLSFTATLGDLDPLTYAYFNHMSFGARVEEVIGGLLI